MTDRNITDCHPQLQELIPQFISGCAAQYITVKVIVTWRDPADQNEAKAEGLSNAAAGQSPHNCISADGAPRSKAFDFGVFEDDGSYVTDGTDTRYAQAGHIATDLGMYWGGNFTHPDYDHVELVNWKEIV